MQSGMMSAYDALHLLKQSFPSPSRQVNPLCRRKPWKTKTDRTLILRVCKHMCVCKNVQAHNYYKAWEKLKAALLPLKIHVLKFGNSFQQRSLFFPSVKYCISYSCKDRSLNIAKGQSLFYTL